MKTPSLRTLLLAVICAITLSASVNVAVAQTVPPAATSAASPATGSTSQTQKAPDAAVQPDQPKQAPAAVNTTAVDLVTWLTPLLVPLLIAGLKKVAPNVPSWALPLIAPCIGMLIDVVGRLSDSHQGNLFAAAALGLAGVGLREVKDQLIPAADKPAST